MLKFIRPTQLANMFAPILVALFAISTVSRTALFENAFASMVVILLNFKVVNFVLLNAFKLIFCTLSAFIAFKLEPSKALAFIVVTFAFIVICSIVL